METGIHLNESIDQSVDRRHVLTPMASSGAERVREFIYRNGGVISIMAFLVALMGLIWWHLSSRFDDRFEGLAKIQENGFNRVDKGFEIIEQRFTTVGNDINSIRAEVNSVRAEVNSVRADVNSVRTDMKEEFRTVREEIKEVRQNLNDLRINVHEIEARISQEQDVDEAQIAAKTDH